MSFVWDDFLVLADSLSKRADDSWSRTAVSRAYYAAFHLVRDITLMRNPDKKFEGASQHKQLWDFLKNSANRADQKLAEDGIRLSGYRTDADYRIHVAVGQRNADAACRLARKIILNVRSGGASPK